MEYFLPIWHLSFLPLYSQSISSITRQYGFDLRFLFSFPTIYKRTSLFIKKWNAHKFRNNVIWKSNEKYDLVQNWLTKITRIDVGVVFVFHNLCFSVPSWNLKDDNNFNMFHNENFSPKLIIRDDFYRLRDRNPHVFMSQSSSFDTQWPEII